MRRISPTALAAIVSAAVGLVAWLAPKAVGGGYPLAREALTGDPAVGGLVALLVGRFALTLVSYGTGQRAAIASAPQTTT